MGNLWVTMISTEIRIKDVVNHTTAGSYVISEGRLVAHDYNIFNNGTF